MSEYYRAYEQRYQAVQSVGDYLWGHQPDDALLMAALDEWVTENALPGKHVAEFACGEGVIAEKLCELGCVYRGCDIAPTAVEVARRRIARFPGASVAIMDMVNERYPANSLDAALDASGLHMLVVDAHRAAYLRNVYQALKPGGVAMFYQEAWREDAYPGPVASIEDWQRITGVDLVTPEPRVIGNTGIEVMLPLLPARPLSAAAYRAEFEAAGFEVTSITPIEGSDFMATSATIKVRKRK